MLLTKYVTRLAEFERTFNFLFLEWGLGACVNQLVGNKCQH